MAKGNKYRFNFIVNSMLRVKCSFLLLVPVIWHYQQDVAIQYLSHYAGDNGICLSSNWRRVGPINQAWKNDAKESARESVWPSLSVNSYVTEGCWEKGRVSNKYLKYNNEVISLERPACCCLTNIGYFPESANRLLGSDTVGVRNGHIIPDMFHHFHTYPKV